MLVDPWLPPVKAAMCLLLAAAACGCLASTPNPGGNGSIAPLNASAPETGCGRPGAAEADSCFRALAVSSGNASVCLALDSGAYACARDVGLAAAGTGACNLTRNATLREWCVEGASVSSGDPRMCSGIGRMEDEARCVRAVAAATNDSSACGLIAFRTEKDLCLLDAGKALRSAPVCGGVSNPALRLKCLLNVGAATGNATLCSLSPDIIERAWCLTEIARTTGEASACARITGGGPLTEEADALAHGCLTKAAIAGRDAGLCADMATRYYAEGCLLEYAAALNDSSACAGIIDGSVRGACEAAASGAPPAA
jgi:hypothetical protein